MFTAVRHLPSKTGTKQLSQDAQFVIPDCQQLVDQTLQRRYDRWSSAKSLSVIRTSMDSESLGSSEVAMTALNRLKGPVR